MLRGRRVGRVESPEQSEAGSEGQMCFYHLGQVGGHGDPGGTSQKPSRMSTGTRMGLAMLVFIGCSEAQILCDDVLLGHAKCKDQLSLFQVTPHLITHAHTHQAS